MNLLTIKIRVFDGLGFEQKTEKTENQSAPSAQ